MQNHAGLRAMLFLHNEPERGSYFRMLAFAGFLQGAGIACHVYVSARHAKFRPRPAVGVVGPASVHEIQMIECPNWTLFHDRQEGWGLLDLAYRCAEVLRHRPSLVVMASHKPSCLLPGLLARLLGAKIVYDWVDWWTGPGGIFRKIVVRSEAFLSMALPIRWWRRAGFAMEAVLEWLAPRVAHRVLLISEDLRNHPAGNCRAIKSAPVIISGAPLDQIRPMDKTDCRAHFPEVRAAAGKSVWLGYLAGFHGAEQLLLEALAHAVRNGADVHLLAAGAPMSQLHADVAATLHGRIHALGRLPFDKVASFLAACDLLLLPLTAENYDRGRYPHKLGDYLAAGRPVLTTPVGEAARRMRAAGLYSMISETVSAADFGLLIRKWAAKTEDWQSAGALCRKAAENDWTWDRVRAEFLQAVPELRGR